MIAPANGYSSDLEGFLHVGSARWAIRELGPDYCVLRSPAPTPPSDGEIVLTIDGEASRIPVVLPEGIDAAEARVTYRAREAANS